MNNKKTKQLKIIPLGGNGEVTKNMYVYEYEDHQLIVDCGIGFPNQSMLGVDVLIPDIDYLEKNPKKLHGIVVTHGHEDHIGGLPYILPRLPKDLPVYGSTLTTALAEVKVREYGLTNPFHAVEDHLDLGPFNIDLIHITHSIPNCKHLLIKTPAGTVYHGADFKFDLTPPDNKPPDINAIAKAGDEGIDLLLSDCLRIEKAGVTLPERRIGATFEDELRKTKGKFVVTSISSSILRFGLAIDAAAKFNRKVALVGRSVERNIKIAIRLGFLKVPNNTLIEANRIKNYKDSQIAVIIAGSQGQEGSSMQRAAAGEHRFVKFKKGDRVVISSDPIPGNESNVFSLIDTLTKIGVDVAYSDVTDHLHVSGHGYRGELELLARLTKAKNYFPIGGQLRHQHLYRRMISELNIDPAHVFIPSDGQTLILKNGQITYGDQLDLKNIYVDGLGIGDVGKVVLRDRQVMAKDGILVAIIPVGHESGKVEGDIEIVSRGFVYVKENQELIGEIKAKVKSALKDQKGLVTDWNFLRKKISDSLEKFIFYKTERNPLILPVIVEV